MSQPRPWSIVFGKWARFLAALLLLIVGPLVLASLIAEQHDALAAERDLQERAEQTAANLQKLLRLSEPAFFTEDRCRLLTRLLFRRRPPPNGMPRFFERLRGSGGLAFEAYVFDQNGFICTAPGWFPPLANLMERLWKFFLFRVPDPNLAQSLEKTFGEAADPNMLGVQRGRLTPIGYRDAPAWFFWDYDPFSIHGGVALVIDRMPDRLDLIRNLVPRVFTASTTLFLREPQGRVLDLANPLPTAERRQVESRFSGSGEGWRLIKGQAWVSAETPHFTIFAGISPDFAAARHRHLLRLGLLLTFGLLMAAFAYRWFIRESDFSWSLKTRLVVLFLFAIWTPLGFAPGLAMQGAHLLVEQKREECRKTARDLLLGIDAAFVGEQGETGRLERFFRGLSRELMTFPPPPDFETRLLELRARQRVANYQLFDLFGGTLNRVDLSAGEVFRPQLAGFWRTFALEGVSRHLKSRLHEPGFPFDEWNRDFTSFALMASRRRNLSAILDVPDRLHAQGSDFWYWNVFRDPKHPAALVLFQQSGVWAVENFLERTFSRRQVLDQGAFQFFATRDDASRWFPHEAPFPRDLVRLVKTTACTKRPLSSRFAWRGRNSLVQSLPSRNLPGIQLLAFYPEAQIQEVGKTLYTWRAGGFVLLLLGTGVGAFLLAEAAVAPLLGVSLIEAVQKRSADGSVTLKETGKGGVDQRVQVILENLEQVDSARLVQAGLFPRHPLEMEAYRVIGRSESATELGGDYFDYLPMSDGRLLAVVGDVTGHGIAAALVVSMAKAVLSDFSRSGDDPQVLLQKLNAVLCESLNQRRLMTMALAILDPRTHQGQFFNCGHPYPIILHPNGTFTFIGMPGRMLGRRLRELPRPTAFSLAPGERLALYTDGLVESLPTPEKGDQFDVFAAFLSGLHDLPLDQALKTAFATHPHTRLGKLQPDDFTLLLIEHTRP